MNTRYTFRRNAFEKPRTLRCEADGIGVDEEGRDSYLIPYSQIKRVRLTFSPTRFDLARYCCELKRRGAGALTITSTTFESFGSFANQAETYTPFIRDLHRHLSQQPGADFRSGVSALHYWAVMLFSGGSLLFMLLVLFLTGLLFIPAIAIAKLFILICYVPWAIAYFIKNRPRSYDPLELPKKLMPVTAAQAPPPLPQAD